VLLLLKLGGGIEQIDVAVQHLSGAEGAKGVSALGAAAGRWPLRRPATAGGRCWALQARRRVGRRSLHTGRPGGGGGGELRRPTRAPP
jgi:hypothetical protein